MLREQTPAVDPPHVPFSVGPRFVLGAELGAGAFGAVYVARDHLLDRDVALKWLRRADAAAVYRFKQEFRALAGLYHPNLVRMHELFSIDDEWFFTMDLIEGAHFRAFVRGGDHDPQTLDTVVVAGGRRTTSSAELPQAAELDRRAGAGRGPVGLCEDRLRHALGQLALGVQALHDAGMVHRDLKPSNVLVTHGGERVKILDFGLVASLHGDEQGERGTISGTPAYMAPEQAMALPLGPAADWYAVGVMLYEALRGRLPFVGGLSELLRRRPGSDPADPRSFATGLPDDLCDLAMALLRHEPHERPSGAEVLAAVGQATPGNARTVSAAPAWAPVDARPVFVGRERSLEALRAAFAESRRGQAVLVEVVGPSGIGKTALVQEFLQVHAREALVLRGRCYAHESVPFKALDGVIDALTQEISILPPVWQAALRPRHAAALARLFPVLGRVGFDADEEAVAPNPQEHRRRAFAALRQVIARASSTQALVIFIDDVQWGDDDSAALLGELCSPPDPPALLLVGTSRPAVAGGAPRMFQEIARRAGSGTQLRRIELQPLEAEESRRMAEALLGPSHSPDDVRVAAEAAHGSPLFVAELARALREGGAGGTTSLADVIAARLDRLPSDARLLLEMIAIIGRPIDEDLVRAAASRERMAGRDAVAELSAAQLIRVSGSQARPTLETPHDRIREEIVARIPAPTLRRYHGHVAEALLADAARDDPEALAIHLAAAGDEAAAAVHSELAGDRASSVLAFDRAATLYAAALPSTSDPDGRLRAKLAGALANAGRGVRAAECYLESVAGAPATQALELRRRAAEQLLRAGHIDQGTRVVEDVLAAVGLRFPHGEGEALGSLLLNRLRLALRLQTVGATPNGRLDDGLLREIDVCWSVANGLGGVDLLRGAGFQARHLLLALRAGEPYRIARALSWEAILRALEGTRGQRQATQLIARAEEITRRISHPHATAWAAAASAVKAWCEGRWRECSMLCEYSSALFRERCADIFWELGSLEIWFNLPALYFRGDLRVLARRAPQSAREAEDRGDLYAATTVRTYILPLVYLAADEPESARATTVEALASWSSEGWHLQHWSDLLCQTQIDLYVGDPVAAAARLAGAWPKLERSHQLRIQNIRMQAGYWRARAALAVALGSAAEARDGRHALRLARITVERLDAEQHPLATALARSLELGIALVAEDAAPWVRAELAAEAFVAAEMPLQADAHALVGDCLRAHRQPSQPAVARARATTARLRDGGVVAPSRHAALLAPAPPGLDLDPVGARSRR